MTDKRFADEERLLHLLPAPLAAAVRASGPVGDLLEIVLDLGRAPEVHHLSGWSALEHPPLTAAELGAIAGSVGSFNTDNRAGIDGTLHRVSRIRGEGGLLLGFTLRLGRAVPGAAAMVGDITEAGDSLLLLGPPGVGKTTVLRDCARHLAERGRRVIVIDSCGEIAGWGKVPHPGLGRARRMPVPADTTQAQIMIEAVENHCPEVIVVDEIGNEAEAAAARTIAERGVQLIATAHGRTLSNLLKNPQLCDLVGGIQAVILSDEQAMARGTQKTRLERKAPPTFDALAELVSHDKLMVHRCLQLAVDELLDGGDPRTELRLRGENGQVVSRLPETERHFTGRAVPKPQRKQSRDMGGRQHRGWAVG